MAFQTNDEVFILKAQGDWDGKYHYGGYTETVPLNTRGTVIGPAKSGYRVQTECGRNWYFLASELGLSNPISQFGILQKDLDSMPRHPLFSLSDKSLVTVIQGSVYVGKRRQDQRIKVENREVQLTKITTLDQLDQLYLARFAQRSKKLSEKYASQIQHMFQPEAKVTKPTLEQRVYQEVFPHLRDNKFQDKLANALGVENIIPSQIPATEKYKTKVLKQIKLKIDSFRRQILEYHTNLDKDADLRENIDRLLGYTGHNNIKYQLTAEVLRNSNFMLCQGQALHVSNRKLKNRTILKADGKDWYLTKKKQSISQKLLVDEISREIILDSIDDYLTDEQLKKNISGNPIELVRGKKEYRERNFGFTTNNGNLYVYLDMPPIAIKSQYDGNYFFFDKSRIAIEVLERNGKLTYDYYMFLIENNNHPFIHLNEDNFAEICTGRNIMPTKGSSGEVIAQRLRKTQEILMFGYKGNAYYDCYELRKKCPGGCRPHYAKNLTTKKWLEKRNIPIIQGGHRR
tara:strand:+ start:32561 stop:34105 length:1545 start_codon:yes stop_codon:yes gene_type:complete